MNDDGSCNTLPLVSTMTNLKNFKGVIISKVTATPNVYEYLQTQYPNLVHVPEFLTAANAVKDYAKENWAIIGGSTLAYQREADRVIKYSKPDVESVFCTIGEAAMVKYIINSFLATKVVFMNEMCQLAKAQGVLISALGPKFARLVTHLDIDDEGMEYSAEVLRKVLQHALMSK